MNAFLLAFSISTFFSVCLFLVLFSIYTFKPKENEQSHVDRLSIGTGSLLPGFFGCFLQIVLLVQFLWNENGQFNLSFSHALLICALIITLLCLIISLFMPIVQLLVIFLPINILVVIFSVAYPHSTNAHLTLSLALEAHILLSICAYSVLAFASMVAILFACKDWQVKNHRFGILWQTLPSLQSLEKLLFQLLSIGFVLLTVGIVVGFIDLDKWFTHKIIFSIIAWLVFASLLTGRYFWGWRGQKAIKLTLTGMVFLLLAFFGSKFVLEIILSSS